MTKVYENVFKSVWKCIQVHEVYLNSCLESLRSSCYSGVGSWSHSGAAVCSQSGAVVWRHFEDLSEDLEIF